MNSFIEMVKRKMPKYSNVQIINVDQNGTNVIGHYICVNDKAKKRTYVYDSLKEKKLSASTVEHLKELLPKSKDNTLVTQKNTQPDNSSNVVFAIAYATTLSLGEDPAEYSLLLDNGSPDKTTPLRNHLAQMLEEGELSLFPKGIDIPSNDHRIHQLQGFGLPPVQPPINPEFKIVKMRSIEAAIKKLNVDPFLTNIFQHRQTRKTNATVMVAERNEHPIGLIYGFQDDDDESAKYIAYVVVVDAHKNLGVGTALIAKFETLAKEEDYSQITCSLAINNRAINLFSRLNYERLNYSRFSDKIIDMVKTL